MMTLEEIRAIYNQGPEAVIAPVEQLYLLSGQQEEQIAHFQAWLREVENRLATHSRNSSKPSSDGLVKQRRSLRESSTRKSGGQPGHRGATLEPVAELDRILLHKPRQGRAGGSVLHEGAG